jgi:hypothetical protein
VQRSGWRRDLYAAHSGTTSVDAIAQNVGRCRVTGRDTNSEKERNDGPHIHKT